MRRLEKPLPATDTGTNDHYRLERPVASANIGETSKKFIDLYRRGAFVLETKQGADKKRSEGGRKLRTGHGKRGTRAWEATMEAARNQAEGYARNLEAAEPPPPFIVVSDVGYCIDLYADFSGSGRLYRPFPDAATNRISLAALRQPDVRARQTGCGQVTGAHTGGGNEHAGGNHEQCGSLGHGVTMPCPPAGSKFGEDSSE